MPTRDEVPKRLPDDPNPQTDPPNTEQNADPGQTGNQRRTREIPPFAVVPHGNGRNGRATNGEHDEPAPARRRPNMSTARRYGNTHRASSLRGDTSAANTSRNPPEGGDARSAATRTPGASANTPRGSACGAAGRTEPWPHQPRCAIAPRRRAAASRRATRKHRRRPDRPRRAAASRCGNPNDFPPVRPRSGSPRPISAPIPAQPNQPNSLPRADPASRQAPTHPGCDLTPSTRRRSPSAPVAGTQGAGKV